jgi:sugar lactone lactonase YvrE
MKQPRKTHPEVRPSVERLEDRSLPSGMAGLDMSLMGMVHHAVDHARRVHSRDEDFAPIVPQLAAITPQTTLTTPPNGDVNPYGVAFVPHGFRSDGALESGDVLVSNFNDTTNTQGTGTTIVRVTPSGQQSVFFTSSLPGLSTALGVMRAGFVIVGNVPNDGNGNVLPGSLQILNSHGQPVNVPRLNALITDPWDLAVNDLGSLVQVFVANVSGSAGPNGTVVRIDLAIVHGAPRVLDEVRIGSGYMTRLDPNAFVVGPTGLAFDPQRDTLYVASTGDNTVFAIPHAGLRFSDAGTGRGVFSDPAHLRGPLGLVLAPNGDLIAANGDAINGDPTQPSELVEFTPRGKFVSQFSLDPAQGAAFGLAVTSSGHRTRFAAVNDDTNSVEIWTLDG